MSDFNIEEVAQTVLRMPSSGRFRRLVLARSDLSEEHITCIIKVKRISS
jgi:hypothetical protein